jgi:hypothetical protein
MCAVQPRRMGQFFLGKSVADPRFPQPLSKS